jgi:hypothetical protein
MAKKIILMNMLIAVSLCVGTAWAEPQMNPGNWEITTKTEMAGMPPQSVTHTQCITNDDIVPVSNDANQECRVTDIQINGNTVSWEMTCGGEQNGMDGTGQVVYAGDSMKGTMTFTIKPYGTTMKNTLSGRRIGNCDGQSVAASSSQTAQPSPASSVIGQTVKKDAKDVGQAAKDEAKQTTIDEVRKGVGGFFKKMF